MLIDFHTHAFPDALASRAMSSLGGRVDFAPTSDGTVSGLIKSMDEDGVDISVVCEAER